jgi:hypothetical protein
MKIKTISGKVLFESEAKTINETLVAACKEGVNLWGANLEGADLYLADLEGADLYLADLRGIINYSDNHDIFFELIRRRNIETFKKSECELIGKLAIHRHCWSTIKMFPVKPVLRVCKILADAGWGEYLEKFKQAKGE